MANYKNIKLILNYTLGVILFLWISALIYRQVQHHENLQDALSLITQHWSTSRIVQLIFVFVLMLVNWGIEAVKWQFLLKDIQQIPFMRSLRSVFTGISVSLLTPNRIGEYAGRIIYLKNINKLKGISVNILGSFAQFIAAAIFGIFGIIYYLFFGKFYWFLVITLICSIVILIILVLAYFKIGNVLNWLSQYTFYRKIKKYINVVRHYSIKDLQKIILLSSFRYLVFAFQYYLLLKIFYVNISFVHAIPTIFLIFWAMAIIPTITITEISTRTTTSFFFFSVFTNNTIGVIASSFTLWIVNLIIPALLGALFILGTKIFVRKDEENGQLTVDS